MTPLVVRAPALLARIADVVEQTPLLDQHAVDLLIE